MLESLEGPRGDHDDAHQDYVPEHGNDYAAEYPESACTIDMCTFQDFLRDGLHTRQDKDHIASDELVDHWRKDCIENHILVGKPAPGQRPQTRSP